MCIMNHNRSWLARPSWRAIIKRNGDKPSNSTRKKKKN